MLWVLCNHWIFYKTSLKVFFFFLLFEQKSRTFIFLSQVMEHGWMRWAGGVSGSQKIITSLLLHPPTHNNTLMKLHHTVVLPTHGVSLPHINYTGKWRSIPNSISQCWCHIPHSVAFSLPLFPPLVDSQWFALVPEGPMEWVVMSVTLFIHAYKSARAILSPAGKSFSQVWYLSRVDTLKRNVIIFFWSCLFGCPEGI